MPRMIQGVSPINRRRRRSICGHQGEASRPGGACCSTIHMHTSLASKFCGSEVKLLIDGEMSNLTSGLKNRDLMACCSTCSRKLDFCREQLELIT